MRSTPRTRAQLCLPARWCAANISGEDHLKGMNPVDINVDRPAWAQQSTIPSAGHPATGSVSTSIKLQSRDACVDEARGQFIIRSIYPTPAVLFFAVPALRQVSRPGVSILATRLVLFET